MSASNFSPSAAMRSSVCAFRTFKSSSTMGASSVFLNNGYCFLSQPIARRRHAKGINALTLFFNAVRES